MLVFVDTNIFLDAYRQPQSEVSQKLLTKLAEKADSVVCPSQVAMELRKNRQRFLGDFWKLLQGRQNPTYVPAFLAASEAAKELLDSENRTRQAMRSLQKEIEELLRRPASDPILAILDSITETCVRDTPEDADTQRRVWEAAHRRFHSGAPPRKPDDVSLGDALNWEWILELSRGRDEDLMVVSRDGDYGTWIDPEGYVNEVLASEYARTNPGRIVRYTWHVAKALKALELEVRNEDVKAEEEITRREDGRSTWAGMEFWASEGATSTALVGSAGRFLPAWMVPVTAGEILWTSQSGSSHGADGN